MDNADFVKDQLKSVHPRREGPKMTFICCPWHAEKTPSGRVNHDPSGRGAGNFKCYGCGRTAGWNELAATLGLERLAKFGFPKDGSVPVTPENRFLTELFEEKKTTASQEDLILMDLSDPIAKRLGVSRKWRGFSIAFLDGIGVKIAFNAENHRYHMWLPVFIRGKLCGHILAAIKKPSDKAIPSYLNASGVWSLKRGLFPFDSALSLMRLRGFKTVVVVEGPRDALRLISLGFPSVSMLGTHSWTDAKSRQLELSGVEKLVIMMDGDTAGRQATYFLRSGKRKLTDEQPAITPLREFFKTKIVKLWNLEVDENHFEDKYDPGNLPEETLLEILTPIVT